MDEESFALKYRPKSFADLVGQKATRAILAAMVKRNKVPSGLLFSGPSGSGKTTSARILAAALNCTSAETKPCAECPSCKDTFAGTSVDVLEVDAASHGSVVHVRELAENLRYSTGGSYRCLLLDECHAMSREAYYALLKILEEPPVRTVFILITTEPHRILDTVYGRLMPFQFRGISAPDITARLQHINEIEKCQMDDELLGHIAQRAPGLRDAVMTMDQFARLNIRTLEQFSLLTGWCDYGPLLFGAMVAGDISAVFTLVDQQLEVVGDPLAITSTVVTLLKGALLSGSQLPAQTLYRAIRACWELETRLQIRDPRSALDMLLIILTETLSGQSNLAQQVKKPEPKKLTLSEMQNL